MASRHLNQHGMEAACTVNDDGLHRMGKHFTCLQPAELRHVLNESSQETATLCQKPDPAESCSPKFALVKRIARG